MGLIISLEMVNNIANVKSRTCVFWIFMMKQKSCRLHNELFYDMVWLNWNNSIVSPIVICLFSNVVTFHNKFGHVMVSLLWAWT